jgi:hypothetical protein
VAVVHEESSGGSGGGTRKILGDGVSEGTHLEILKGLKQQWEDGQPKLDACRCFIHDSRIMCASMAWPSTKIWGLKASNRGAFSRHEETSTNNKIENDFNLTIGLEFRVFGLYLAGCEARVLKQ